MSLPLQGASQSRDDGSGEDPASGSSQGPEEAHEAQAPERTGMLPPPRVIDGMWVVGCHSSLTLEEQQRVFQAPPPGAVPGANGRSPGSPGLGLGCLNKVCCDHDEAGL